MSVPAPSEADLAGATDAGRFARGVDYVRYVRGLQVHDGRASASVQAKRVYEVSLEWSSGQLAGRCTCGDPVDAFCKHLVAVGLAVIDAENGRSPADPESLALTGYLAGLDHGELVDLVRQLVARDADGRAEVLARAAAAGHGEALDPEALVAEVNDALSVRGFIDYRRSFEVARDVEQVLDRLARLLDAGAADAVRPALLRALTRLRQLLLQRVDDSAGVLGDACQRAADLYARACREGAPDPVALARWLVKFRQDSPGWPETTLADFVPAFDQRALTTYRRGVAGWDRRLREADQIKRGDVERALLELVDHDGDLDAAVELLTQHPGHEQYAEVVRRLEAAGRTAEALRWLDRAVTAGRVSGFAGQQHNGYWLSPAEASRLYLASGQSEDALAVLRQELARRPGVETWRALLDLARRLDREVEQRVWAVAEVERIAATSSVGGAALVQIALAEDRLDDAWRAAERYDPGSAWEALARASARDRPAEAAALYRPHVEQLLVYPDTTKYAPAADLLVRMRDLYAAAEQPERFEAYLSDLRERYVRRTSLMRALAARGL